MCNEGGTIQTCFLPFSFGHGKRKAELGGWIQCHTYFQVKGEVCNGSLATFMRSQAHVTFSRGRTNWICQSASMNVSQLLELLIKVLMLPAAKERRIYKLEASRINSGVSFEEECSKCAITELSSRPGKHEYAVTFLSSASFLLYKHTISTRVLESNNHTSTENWTYNTLLFINKQGEVFDNATINTTRENLTYNTLLYINKQNEKFW